jgi:putative transposase
MTQGKMERYHRSMKNLILLDNYYSPAELGAHISEWVDHYNNQRYHEASPNGIN